MKDVVIFDLDDTLFDITHRKHYVECPKPEQDWDAFYDACDKDVPKNDIVRILRLFQRDVTQLYKIFVFTGRSAKVKQKTLRQFRDNDILVHPDDIFMRPEDDNNTPDHVLKLQWAKQVGLERIWCVFEDRQRVVDAWRAAGVTCLQVAPGDF